MSKHKILFVSMIFCMLQVVDVAAAIRGTAGSHERVAWCKAKLASCLDTADEDCVGSGVTSHTDVQLCELSEGKVCNDSYGAGSTCETRARVSITSPLITPASDQKVVEVPENNVAPPVNTLLVVPLVAPSHVAIDKPGPTVVNPGVKTFDHRIQTGASIITNSVAASNNVVATPLNSSECKTLGGAVQKVSVCNSGKGCSTTDQNGRDHVVCLSSSSEVVVDEPKDKSRAAAVSSSVINQPMIQTGNMMARPLTSQECKGLGGTVLDTEKARKICEGKDVCSTVDKYGVARWACIDGVAH